jgi:hypothetical protein
MINWLEILRREEDSADNQNDEGVRVLVVNLIVPRREIQELPSTARVRTGNLGRL